MCMYRRVFIRGRWQELIYVLHMVDATVFVLLFGMTTTKARITITERADRIQQSGSICWNIWLTTCCVISCGFLCGMRTR